MQIYPILIVSAIPAFATVAYLLYLAHTFGAQKALTQLSQLTEVIGYWVQQADALIGKSNEEKYKYVADQASEWMSDRGVKIPPDVVERIIEGAVKLVHRASNQPTQ